MMTYKLVYLPADKDFQRFEGVGCHNPRSDPEYDTIRENRGPRKPLENQETKPA